MRNLPIYPFLARASASGVNDSRRCVAHGPPASPRLAREAIAAQHVQIFSWPSALTWGVGPCSCDRSMTEHHVVKPAVGDTGGTGLGRTVDGRPFACLGTR